MKKKILLVIIAITSFSSLNAQEKKEFIKINYELNVKLDAEKIISSIPKNQRGQYENLLRAEISKGIFVNYNLITNGEKSIFKIEEKINNDPTTVNQIINQITSLDKEPLIKEINKEIFYKGYDMGGKLYVVKDSLKNYEWKLTKESKTINGYKVLKAEGFNDGEVMIAWYSSDLKYKDGPDHFWGLPGVILELKFYNKRFDTNLEFKAKSIVNKGNDFKIKDYSEKKYLTEKELMNTIEQINKKYRENSNNGVDID